MKCSLDMVIDDALVLHLTQHGGNGCRCKAPLFVEGFVDLGNCCLFPQPENPHDGVLQFPECVLAH